MIKYCQFGAGRLTDFSKLMGWFVGVLEFLDFLMFSKSGDAVVFGLFFSKFPKAFIPFRENFGGEAIKLGEPPGIFIGLVISCSQLKYFPAGYANNTEKQ